MSDNRDRVLVLMRHAAAAGPGSSGSHADHDRPLTADGWSDAAAAGAWVTSELPPVDAVLCSTAARARQTLEATGVQAPIGYLPELYNGGIDDILEVIAAAPAEARTVLVIGHAPGIAATAHDLVTIAQLAAAGDALSAGADGADGDPVGDGPGTDELRGFSAGALAVLRPHGSWAEIAERGAELLDVRHPRG